MKFKHLFVFLVSASGGAFVTGHAADLPVISGGVGLDEREAMMQHYGDYNLHLGFARPGGEFLADVKITTQDAKGNILYEGRSDGPLLFAELPLGSYRVTAEFEGATRSQVVKVGRGSGPIRYFYF
jgi:hypothetical protein